MKNRSGGTNDDGNKSFGSSDAMSLGFNMAAGMAVFTYLGYWLDQKMGGGQGWTLAGIFLGLFYCGYEVWKLVRQVPKNPPDIKETASGGKK